MTRKFHRRRISTTRTTNRYRPGLQALEPRALLAADLGFTPLSTSATLLPTGDPAEVTAPFLLAAGYEQEVINYRTNDPDALSNLDMTTLNENGPQAGRYIFTASEAGSNAGVNRTDLVTGDTVILAQRTDFERFDGIRWTPWGTVLVNEETAPGTNADGLSAVNGLVYEILNPLADPADIEIVARPALGSQSHEGIAIDAQGNVYGIDELNGGAIYKFVPNSYGDLSSGVLYALKDVAGGDGADLGSALWAPLNNANGTTIPGVTDPRVNGRQAADDVGATNYLRPEDLEIGTLANGHQALYVATTTDHRVLSIELIATPIVREFVTDDTIDVATGAPVDASGETFTNPDNLAIDAQGRIFIIEDNNAGDLWGSFDVDGDGVAEGIGRLASVRVTGSEPTGMYFNPFNPNEIFVNVQHPSSGNDSIVAIRTVEGEAGAKLVGGVLAVYGTGGDDEIEIEQKGRNIVVEINDEEIGRFHKSDVDQIRADAGNGDDVMSVDVAAAIEVLLFGSGGNDLLCSGPGHNIVSGGRGNDGVFGGNGNDELYGNDGDDVLFGGNGSDFLYGGEGNDVLFGGNGADALFGEAGDDWLFGENGADLLDGGDDFDRLFGGHGADLLLNGEFKIQ